MRTTNVTSVLRAKRTGKAVLGVPLMHMGESKVECTLVQSLRLCTGRTAHRGSRALALLFLNHGTRRGEGSASRPGRSLPPRKTRYPFYRRLGGPQGRSRQVRKISPPPVAQSLYRLSYPAHVVRKMLKITANSV